MTIYTGMKIKIEESIKNELDYFICYHFYYVLYIYKSNFYWSWGYNIMKICQPNIIFEVKLKLSISLDTFMR